MSNYKLIGVIGLFISIILIVSFSEVVFILTDLIERYMSQDHHIEPEGILFIETLVFVQILMVIVLSVFSFFNLYHKLSLSLSTLIDKESMISFFLRDAICTKSNLPVFLFLGGTLSSVFLHFYLLVFGQPLHEGFIEKYSSLLLLISAFILLVSYVRIKRDQFSLKIKKQIRTFLIVITIMLIFLFGEEISWGQRIFDWESFSVFKEYNTQSEINTHNFFNPLFKFLYPAVGLSSFILLFIIWVFPRRDRNYLFHLITPPSSLFFLCFIMACSSFNGHSEIYEELLAIFFLLYSIRIFVCLQLKKDRIPSSKYKN